METAWRIVRKQYVDSAFSGIGAEQYGGRWNSPGRKLVYVASSLALAAMETLVHLPYPLPAKFHKECDFQAFRVGIPDEYILSVEATTLPEDWQSEPPSPSTQRIGNRWVNSDKSPVLRMPSVLVPQEDNFLINPEHKNFAKLRIHDPIPYTFDARLMQSI